MERTLARRFADAYVAADIDGVVALLTDDAWLSMPPAPHQYHGIPAIWSMLRASFDYRGGDRMYLVPTRANTQPALAGYVSDRARGAAFPSGLFVLAVADARIHAITRFHTDELYPRFGLPRSLPEAGGRRESPTR
jgi:RNA polymerase sigma-70 factor (ECF subfamily)